MAMMRRTVDVPRQRKIPMIDTMINRTSATSVMRAPIGMVMMKKTQQSILKQNKIKYYINVIVNGLMNLLKINIYMNY